MYHITDLTKPGAGIAAAEWGYEQNRPAQGMKAKRHSLFEGARKLTGERKKAAFQREKRENDRPAGGRGLQRCRERFYSSKAESLLWH